MSERVNAEMVKRFIPDFIERTFYTSGPQKMVDAIVSLSREVGIPETRIKQEYFPVMINLRAKFTKRSRTYK